MCKTLHRDTLLPTRKVVHEPIDLYVYSFYSELEMVFYICFYLSLSSDFKLSILSFKKIFWLLMYTNFTRKWNFICFEWLKFLLFGLTRSSNSWGQALLWSNSLIFIYNVSPSSKKHCVYRLFPKNGSYIILVEG